MLEKLKFIERKRSVGLYDRHIIYETDTEEWKTLTDEEKKCIKQGSTWDYKTRKSSAVNYAVRSQISKSKQKLLKDIEKNKHHELSIPKLQFSVKRSNDLIPGTIYYCASAKEYTSIYRSNIQIRIDEKAGHGHIEPPDTVWAKPKLFPRFIVVLGGRGFGELDPSIQEIEGYIRFLLGMSLTESRVRLSNEQLYELINFSFNPATRMILSKFMQTYITPDMPGYVPE